jgi:hypothetical protein
VWIHTWKHAADAFLEFLEYMYRVMDFSALELDQRQAGRLFDMRNMSKKGIPRSIDKTVLSRRDQAA